MAAIFAYSFALLSCVVFASVPFTKEVSLAEITDYELPEKWKEFCVVRKEVYTSMFTPNETLTHVDCYVTDRFSGVWKMADLRANLENSTSNFSVSVSCAENTSVSLSWPMKVWNLYRFKVKDCVVTDFLGEHNSSVVDVIPDSLRELELNSNRVMISIRRFVSMLKNIRHVSKEFECGHETTVEKLTIRNISYDFMDSYDSQMSLAELGEQFILDSKRVKHKCDFLRLIYLDEGDSDSLSTYHLSLLTESALYDHLRVYNISHNHMAVLQDKVLQWSINFPKLELLDLSHNDVSALYRFEIPVHTRMSQQTTIDLQFNNISSFTVQDIQWFEKMPMVLIDLRNNPISCNCTENMKQLIRFIKDKEYFQQHNLTKYSYISEMTCASPPSMAGKTLGELTPDVLPCEIDLETEYFIVPLICLSASVLVLSVLLFILIKYRREVRILMFTRFHVILPCQMKEALDDKKFDAFVSYSSNDEEWVQKVFERLEEGSNTESLARTFKFCLHHRDFVPGKTIFNNVISSVEASRHTIILISKTFLKSEYCLYEFHEAFQQSIIEQKRHLVIVMMEDIAESELPKDLRRCIKTFTYLKKDDFLFQDRLIYALSVKEKSRSEKSSRKSSSKSSSLSSNGRNKGNSTSNGYSKGQMNGRINGFSNGLGNGRPNGMLKSGHLGLRRSLSTGREMEVIIEEDINLHHYDRSQSCESGDTGYASSRDSLVHPPGSNPTDPTAITVSTVSPSKETCDNQTDCGENKDVRIELGSS